MSALSYFNRPTFLDTDSFSIMGVVTKVRYTAKKHTGGSIFQIVSIRLIGDGIIDQYGTKYQTTGLNGFFATQASVGDVIECEHVKRGLTNSRNKSGDECVYFGLHSVEQSTVYKCMTGFDEIFSFLSNRIKYLRKSTLTSIYDAYGAETVPYIIMKPDAVAFSTGIKLDTILKYKDALTNASPERKLLGQFPHLSIKTLSLLLDDAYRCMYGDKQNNVSSADEYKRREKVCKKVEVSLKANPYDLSESRRYLFHELDEVFVYDLNGSLMHDLRMSYVLERAVVQAMQAFQQNWTYVNMAQSNVFQYIWNVMLGYGLDAAYDIQTFQQALKRKAYQRRVIVEVVSGEIRLIPKFVFDQALNIASFIRQETNQQSDDIWTQRKSDAVTLVRRKIQQNDELFCKMTEEQRHAVIETLSHHLHILTGGPGCGKTWVIRGIIQAWSEIVMNSDILLVGPTGRSVSRLKESTFYDNCETIARFLCANTDMTGNIYRSGSFFTDFLGYHMPINKNTLIVIDECSMVDYATMSAFLHKIEGCSVLFVGDIHQLPPVGLGPTFFEMIHSNTISISQLTESKRATAPILKKVNENTLQGLSFGKNELANLQEFWPIFSSDDAHVCMNDYSYDLLSKVSYWSRDQIIQRYRNLLNDGYDAKDIMVLSPVKKGITGSIVLNALLQDVVNPLRDNNVQKVTIRLDNDANHKKQEHSGLSGTNTFVYLPAIAGEPLTPLQLNGISLRLGDRVMCVKNDAKQTTYYMDHDMDYTKDPLFVYTDGVFNGDTGTLLFVEEATNPKNMNFLIQFDDGRYALIPYDSFMEYEMCYAMTVHKSQGSEAKAVIVSLAPLPRSIEAWKNHVSECFLSRQLLYTAITRSRESLTLIGSKQIYQICLQNVLTYPNCCLGGYLQGIFGQDYDMELLPEIALPN